jgi:hypothetical protein
VATISNKRTACRTAVHFCRAGNGYGRIRTSNPFDANSVNPSGALSEASWIGGRWRTFQSDWLSSQGLLFRLYN